MLANQEDSNPEVHGGRDKNDSIAVWIYTGLDITRNEVIREKV